MDIRDTQEPVPIIIAMRGKGLEKIFDLQKDLINRYIGIEKLPKYPIDIDSKEHQVLVKDFISRILEELAEGFESYLAMMEAKENNLENRDKPKEQIDLIPHLQNFNEEVSDALHFMVELFIYCNISPDDIAKYYQQLLEELNLADAFYFETDLLGTALSYARHCNIDRAIYNNPEYRAIPIILDKDLEDEFLRGGRKLSIPLEDEHRKQLWDITYSFNLARNMLKNKAWKQTEMMTDQSRFQLQLMEGFLHFMRYLDFMGMTTESVFTIYFKKNLINQFRIESNY